MDSLSDTVKSLWQSSPQPPDISQILQSSAGASLDEMLSAIFVDQSFRWRTDQPIMVEQYISYLEKYPCPPAKKIELILQEFKSRGLRPTAENIVEYLSRFDDLRQELAPRFSAMARTSHTLNDITLNFDTATTLEALEPVDLLAEQPSVRYELQRILGEGAFGRVFLAYDRDLERHVAIKFPNDSQLLDSKRREQYLSEARTVAGLNHPNIVPVYDVVRREDGTIYIVSKFIDGCTLEHRINHDRPSFSEAAFIVANIANALHHAHQRRLVHRDVKPGNILWETATGTPYITDFGLAIKGENLELRGRVSGTPPYMSPEQVRGENHRLDARSDIFSLGAILYELLADRRPFEGETPRDIFVEIVNTNPQSLRALNPAVPPELERICLKALAKPLTDRYQTAEEMATDLLRWRRSFQPDSISDQTPSVTTKSVATNADTYSSAHGATLAGVDPTLREKSVTTASQAPAKPEQVKSRRRFEPAKMALTFAAVLVALAGIVGLIIQQISRSSPKLHPVCVTATPPQAKVTISSVRLPQAMTGTGTMEEFSLEPGDYEIQVDAENFETITQTFTVPEVTETDSGKSVQPIQLSIDLLPLSVVVELIANPADARISIDGKPAIYDSQNGGYPLSLGQHVLRIEKANYLPLEHTISVDRNTKTISLPPLKPAGTLVQVTPQSNDLRVLVDNADVRFNQELGGFLLQLGEHTLRFERTGYLPQQKQVTISTDSMTISLEPWKVAVHFQSNGQQVQYTSANGPLTVVDSQPDRFALAEGIYSITATAAGFEPLTQSINVTSDSTIFEFPLQVQASFAFIPADLYANNMVVVRLTPPNFSNAKLVIADKGIVLTNGLGQISWEELGKDQPSWKYHLILEGGRQVTGEFTRSQLESMGARPTVDITIPLSAEAEARKIWLMTRPHLKSDPVDAEIALTKALDLAPKLFEIYRDRAIARAQIQKFAAAEDDIRQCLSVLPDDYLALSVGGLVAIGIGDAELAKTRLDKAITIRPEATQALVVRAMLAYRLKDRQTAKQTLQDLLTKTGADDQLAFAKTILAQIAFSENRFDEGMKWFDEALLHQEMAGLDTVEIRYNRAQATLQLARTVATDDPERARALLLGTKEALGNLTVDEEHPIFARALADLAEVEFALGSYDRTIQIYNKLLDELHIESSKLLEQRAIVLEKRGAAGDAATAEQDRQRANAIKSQRSK